MNDSTAIWLLDEAPVHTRFEAEPDDPALKRREADPAVLIAIRLRLEGASEAALKELAQAEESPDALLLAGQILFELERLEEAAERYGRLAAKYPAHPFANFNHGICAARLGRWRVAAENLQRALVLDPDLHKAWFVLGVCFLNERRLTDAGACFSHSLKLYPDYVPALLGLAAALQKQGKSVEALPVYERLLETRPESGVFREGVHKI